MAADPVLLTLLVGLGLRELSMAPSAIPLAKRVIRGLNAAQGREWLLARALRGRTAAEVEKGIERTDRAGTVKAVVQVERVEPRALLSEDTDSDESCDARGEAVGMHWAKTDRYVGKTIAAPRGARLEPAVSQPEGRDHLPLVRPAASSRSGPGTHSSSAR